MNAISPCPPETLGANQARYARMCDELAELGMGLARIAAQKAAQAPEPSETPARKPAKAPDYISHFIRLARSVQQCIALSARLTATLPAAALPAGAPPAAAAKPTPSTPERPRTDPRRALILRMFEEGTPRHATMRQDIERQTTLTLAADPHAKSPIGALVTGICDALNLQLDPATLTDESLDALTASPAAAAKQTMIV